jgi:hypothetical protein
MMFKNNMQHNWLMRYASAIDAGILAHDVLNGFGGRANGHGLSGLLVESRLQFVEGLFEPTAVAKGTDKWHDAAPLC